MSYPDDPKTLQVLNRIIEVLAAISPADGFFYPVGEGNVIRGVKGWDEITSFPFDMVYLGPEHSAPEYQTDGLVLKFPTVQIEGYVDARGEDDTITRLIKHLADVQRAVNDDSKPGAGADSLGVIAHYARVGIAETDDGMLAGEGKAGFKLSIQCCISGEWGEL
jgi:hypothetical protein